MEYMLYLYLTSSKLVKYLFEEKLGGM